MDQGKIGVKLCQCEREQAGRKGSFEHNTGQVENNAEKQHHHEWCIVPEKIIEEFEGGIPFIVINKKF